MKRAFLFLTMCLFIVTGFSQNGWSRSPNRQKEKNEANGSSTDNTADVDDFNADENDDEGEFMIVSVPKKLKNKQYKILIGDEAFKINGKDLKVRKQLSQMRIRLATEDNRTVAFDSELVRTNALDSFRNRPWRVSAMAGSIEWGGDSWEYLPLEKESSSSWFELSYRFNKIGSFTSFSNTQLKTNSGLIEAFLKEQKYTLGAFYECVPVSHIDNILSHLHINLLAGISASRYEVKLTDSFVTMEESLKLVPGLMVGSGISIPVISNFWIDLRSFAFYQQLKMKEFDLNLRKTQYHYLIGGSYAF